MLWTNRQSGESADGEKLNPVRGEFGKTFAAESENPATHF